VPGTVLWTQMKDNGRESSSAGGGMALFARKANEVHWAN
jgi:hypothetical protein